MGLSLKKEDVRDALEQMGLPLEVRGERLSLQEFAKLSDLLSGR